jgi:tRNA G18 (ribose-2'-O)-methylase SpoU
MFIGVDGVIVNRQNACGLTPTVSKVSSGALEFTPLHSVKFMSKFLEDAKKDPYNFKIISTNLEDEIGLVNDDIEGEEVLTDDDGDDLIDLEQVPESTS